MPKTTKNAEFRFKLKIAQKQGQKSVDLSATYANAEKNAGARRCERWILELGIGFLLLLL